MNAETLTMAAMNDQPAYKSIVHAVKSLRSTIDSVAEAVAKANAAWHDDPDADDHAEFHAPAIEQFTRKTRDKAILDLVRKYLVELNLNDKANGPPM